jgi:hypothetical protein
LFLLCILLFVFLVSSLVNALSPSRWQLYRYAWESSTPLFIAIRDQPLLLHQHEQMKQAEIDAELTLQQNQIQLGTIVSSMPSLHTSLLLHIQDIMKHSVDTVLPSEPLPLNTAPPGADGGTTWRLGVGQGVEVRQKILGRLQLALDELVRKEEFFNTFTIFVCYVLILNFHRLTSW